MKTDQVLSAHTINKELIIATVGFLILIGGVFVVGAKITDYVKQITNKQLEGTIQGQQVEILATLTRQHAVAQQYVLALENVLPERDSLISLDQELETLAEVHGLGFGFTFTGDRPATQSSPGVVEFSLSLQGEFNQLLRYMENVNNLRYFMSFPTFGLARSGDRFTMQLQGQVFTR